MKKIITMILTLAALCFAFPTFADIGAVAPNSGVLVSVMAKAGDETIVRPEMAAGNQSQTANCSQCHKPHERQISQRGKIRHIKHNQTNTKPIVTAGAVFMHPD